MKPYRAIYMSSGEPVVIVSHHAVVHHYNEYEVIEFKAVAVASSTDARGGRHIVDNIDNFNRVELADLSRDSVCEADPA